MIEKNLFDGEIYNVVSSNNTVRDIVDSIRKSVPLVKVKQVESEIMNNLSYDVIIKRLASKGYICKDDIGIGVSETISLLRHSYAH